MARQPEPTRLFLFGDQTYDFVPEMRELLGIRDNPILVAFLEQSHYVVRFQMFRELSPEEHKRSRTASLAELLQKYVDRKLPSAFQTALSCMTQLGLFMRQFDDPNVPYPQSANSYVLGVCTGSLAAAAISCSTSLSELLPIAVQTVLISFRLGLRAQNVRDHLVISQSDRTQPWSVVCDVSPDDVAIGIDMFSLEKGLTSTHRPWITATSAKTLTVSGSPGILSQLACRPPFKNGKLWREIPIYVPAHNARLFSSKDVDDILATTDEGLWSNYGARIPFLSSVTGKLVWARNYRDLIHLALSQCLIEPIRWDLVEMEVPRLLKGRDSLAELSILPFTTTLTRSLSGALAAERITVAKAGTTSNKLPDGYSHRPESGRSKLAIISMSGRFPEAPSTESFWDLLYKGLDVCKEVPSRRWDVKTHVDPSGKAHNKGATRWGCWLDFAGEFDTRFFSISPKEAPQMDPAQRMALMSTYEAMERGGIVPDSTPSTQRNRIGVFHGVTSNDWMETNTAQNIDTYFITGGNRGFIPGRINFCFEFSGPSYSNDTACSSSLAAIHLACNSLWRGDCDTAVAGGTNMIFTPDGHTGLDKGFFLSRTGNCKPFDDAADGYCRAEGVGTVFIKRLEDALADNDPILGTILDIKTNHSAMSESMTRPFAPAQIDNMSAVLSASGISPLDLSYIEMHGTGTQVGDAVEMESVLSLFAPDETFRSQDKPLYVGSAKGNIGHGEGVSGVTSLIKVLLMMKHDTIPPHCGIKPGSRINRNYPDLSARNVHIASEPKPWPRTNSPRRVLINNFSAAGGNTAVLIEDAPMRDAPTVSDPRTSHIVTVSGHVGKSLKSNIGRLRDYLTKRLDISPAELSYTTAVRRWHHLHRVSITGRNTEEILRNLEGAIARGDGVNRPKAKPNIIIACSGQGSQYQGMGRQLYDAYPTFRSDLEQFDQLARSYGFPGFLTVYTLESIGDSMDDLLPVVAQLALVSLEMALGNLLSSFGIKASAVVGHSLGEYAALYIAGILSAADTLFLVGKRAELLQERCQRETHAMLAVRASPTALAEALGDSNCEVACHNGPNDTVLSGSIGDLTNFQVALSTKDIKGTLLKLPFAFHSAQVQPILQEYELIARGVTFHKPKMPVLSPLLVRIIEEQGIVDPAYLARHCREPVDMASVLELARDKQVITDRTIVIDVGPKALLAGMVKMTLGKDSTIALPILGPNLDAWKSLTAVLATLYSRGMDINWKVYHEPFEGTKRVIELPAYAWDLKEYFIPYKGEWCLHRHEIHCSCATPGKETATSDYQLPSEQPVVVKRHAKLDESKEAYPEIKATTTVHRVIEEKTEPLGATLVVETDISRPDVNQIAQGHLVDGIPLCTPSFYADIALQVGRYSFDRLRASHPGPMDGIVDVSDMVVDKALVPHGKSPQLLRSTLTMSWPPKAAATTRSAKIKFATYFADGRLDTEHASCTVRFRNGAQLKSLERQLPEYKGRIRELEEGLRRGEFVRYTTKSGYKLMSSMANFHPDYKLLNRLILNEADNEAVSTMDFSAAKSDGMFAAHPAYVDAITQVGGFAMNANDNTDIQQEVFVNHGWDSFQIYQPLVKGKTYEVYARMTRDQQGDLVHGDTLVLNSDVVVAFFKGLSLRCVPRRGLRMVLQQASDRAARLNGSKPGAKAQPSQGATSAAKIPLIGANQQTSKVALPPIPGHHSTVPGSTAVAESPSRTGVGKANAVLQIISEESGIALEDLTDESNFVDMGIDSLSSMVIGSRLREDLGVELGAEFSLFMDCPTVGSLKARLSRMSAEDHGNDVVVGPEEEAPLVALSDEADACAQNEQASNQDSNHGGEVFNAALKIVSEESGVVFDELTAETVFADIGIDSLSSMVITSRFREDLGLLLDSSFNLFEEVPTVARLNDFFGATSGSSTVSSGRYSSEDDETASTQSAPEQDPVAKQGHDRVSECRPTTSVVLQGLPRMARKILFMLPDGGGSASSYLTIPRLHSDVAIVGLNCPYARDPESMTCTHQSMIQSFCNEIKRRQPQGPYHLGGWSSGGAFAYVTAEALVNAGDEVHSLIIIDAPVPQVMEKLPTSFYEHCNDLGLFANQPGGTTDGTAHPPPYLIPHFQATVDVMLDYRVAPLKATRMPKVGIVWAAETVMDEADVAGFQGLHFMVQRRTDFGPDGWDMVCPGAEFDVIKAEGANHFTLMTKEHICSVRELIDRVMG
ncbi:putative sterigmatocystin biosynthesis polyketide synthase [Aspergillus multicolor]|uniref:putative sterigmatocystin biosynthesis polyketide synthase n=1 Tax=Aspergillus multicolor TaxID=41759 RepID=UPI003CCD6759